VAAQEQVIGRGKIGDGVGGAVFVIIWGASVHDAAALPRGESKGTMPLPSVARPAARKRRRYGADVDQGAVIAASDLLWLAGFADRMVGLLGPRLTIAAADGSLAKSLGECAKPAAAVAARQHK